jgi:hypothetical protein
MHVPSGLENGGGKLVSATVDLAAQIGRLLPSPRGMETSYVNVCPTTAWAGAVANKQQRSAGKRSWTKIIKWRVHRFGKIRNVSPGLAEVRVVGDPDIDLTLSPGRFEAKKRMCRSVTETLRGSSSSNPVTGITGSKTDTWLAYAGVEKSSRVEFRRTNQKAGTFDFARCPRFMS